LPSFFRFVLRRNILPTMPEVHVARKGVGLHRTPFRTTRVDGTQLTPAEGLKKVTSYVELRRSAKTS